MIRTYVDRKQRDWDDLLPYLCLAYNTSVHSSTGSTPYFLLYGREATLPVDIAMDWIPEAQLNQGIFEKMEMARNLAKENLIRTQEYQKKVYDERHGTENKFEIGELVLVRTEFVGQGPKKSIAPRFTQVAKIVGRSPGNVYKVQLGPRSYSWINVERLKKYHKRLDDGSALDAWITEGLAEEELDQGDEEEDVSSVDEQDREGDEFDPSQNS